MTTTTHKELYNSNSNAIPNIGETPRLSPHLMAVWLS